MVEPGILVPVYCSKLLLAFNIFLFFFPIAHFFILFSFSSSLSLSPPLLPSLNFRPELLSFSPIPPLSQDQIRLTLSHLKSDSRHVFVGHIVGLFKVGHTLCLENGGLCHRLNCVGHAWAFLDGFGSQWWWVVIGVVGWFVAVGMGSNRVMGCCGGCGLLIRPWVAMDLVGQLVAVGMGRCGSVGGGVRGLVWGSWFVGRLGWVGVECSSMILFLGFFLLVFFFFLLVAGFFFPVGCWFSG